MDAARNTAQEQTSHLQPTLHQDASAGVSRRRGRAVAAPAAARVSPSGRGGRGRGRPAAGRGRGRGRKRNASEMEAQPLPETEPAQSPAGSSEESDGSSSSEDSSSRDSGSSSSHQGQGEAGHDGDGTAAGEPVPQDAVPQLPVRQQALNVLLGFGVPQDRAEQAIAEVAGEGQEPQSAAEWADEAQLWLACQQEFEDERDKLAEAMQVSLAEAEQRKQEKKPLAECTPEEIQQEFAESEMLLRLLEQYPLAALLAAPLRSSLLSYLELEKRCKKWWPIACYYFQAAAAEVVAQANGSGSAHGETPAAQEVPVAAGSPPGGRQQQQRQAANGRAACQPSLDAAATAALADALERRRAAAEAAVYAMPSNSGADVPAIFSEAVPEGAELGCCIDIASDSDAEGEQPAQQQQQVVT